MPQENDESYDVAPDSRTPEGRIDAESLLEGFDEDADFSSDPEVEEALGNKRESSQSDQNDDHELAHPDRWLIVPGWPSAKMSLIAGGILTIAAVIMSGINAEKAPVLSSLMTLYQVLIHAVTGLLAAQVCAFLSERGMNQVELITARMFAAAAAFYVVLNIPLPFESAGFAEIFLAAIGYLLLIKVQFRLPRYEFLVLVLAHGGMWIAMQIGLSLERSLASV